MPGKFVAQEFIEFDSSACSASLPPKIMIYQLKLKFK